MFLYKYNEYTKKYYKYDMDLYDIMSPMFDETIHVPNDQGMMWGSNNRNICHFCGTVFDSRNQLFYHLGYMNIDIRKPGIEIESSYDIEKGDFGMEPKPYKKRQKRKSTYGIEHRPMKKKMKIGKLSNLLNNMKM